MNQYAYIDDLARWLKENNKEMMPGTGIIVDKYCECDSRCACCGKLKAKKFNPCQIGDNL